MHIVLKSIPHSNQRYPTCGDWIVEPNGDLIILVSDTGNEDYNFLVALHELVEAKLCMNRGIKQEEVDAFDIAFEEARDSWRDNDVEIIGEPGDHPDAPYREEHRFATIIEQRVAEELGVSWGLYEKAVEALGD